MGNPYLLICTGLLSCLEAK
uniref:Uncharacterized protein n=1 Tax=Anguilla anguilla TaxID=7936 RepID=A0A0E9QB90_ANGAN